MAAINLRERDGLHSRLSDVKCPVLWMHGTSDQVYSVSSVAGKKGMKVLLMLIVQVANAEEEIKLFTNCDAKLQVVEGGQHFLSFSHPEIVDSALLQFVKKHA